MKLEILRNGHLNSDTDINMLEGGDYPDAVNIVKLPGANGGGMTLRQYESIKELPIASTNKTFVKALKSGSSIIELYRDATQAFMYRLDSANSTSRTLLFSYTHSVSDFSFIPDIEIIDDYIVWNFYKSGTLLYWKLGRETGNNQTISTLLMSKPCPIGVLSIVKNKTTGLGVGLLETADIQFSSRYRFDTGEYSVLGPYSEMFKGEKDTTSYTFTISVTVDTPVFVVEMDIFARIGDVGTWRRVHTQSINPGTPTSINVTWKGDVFETLATKYSAISFSAIPASIGSITAANNRVFLGNFKDDYDNDAVGTLTITPSTGHTIATSGAIKNYFGADTNEATTNSSESGTYYKPFANNSLYSVGIAFFDESLKTNGVQYITNFSTGLFTYPICPSFTLTQVGGSPKPSFAKFMQLCITKNLTKGSIFEGFASSIYFEISSETTDTETGIVKTDTRTSLSVTLSDVSKVSSVVIDISGMFNAGILYPFNDGDRISINLPGETVGTYRIVDLQVKGSDGDKVYCNWIGGLCQNDANPDSSKLYFEIYSPRQRAEDENILFYGIGDIIDISSSFPSSITNYHLGDTVFKDISFPQYTTTVLNKALTPTVPAQISSGVSMSAINRKLSSANAVVASVVSDNKFDSSVSFSLPLNEFNNPTNDGSSVLDDSVVLGSYYDSKLKITCQVGLDYVYNGSSSGDTLINYAVVASLLKSTYDPYKGTYGGFEKIGVEERIYSHYVDPYTEIPNPYIADYVEFDLSNTNVKINALDKIKIVFEAAVNVSNIEENVVLDVRQKVGVDYSLIMNIIGDRIATEVAYYPKPKVPVSVTKTNFVVRQQSDFGGGKPYLKSPETLNTKRINAIRYGGSMVPGTTVNDLSLFFALDTLEVPIANGEIMSLQRASRLQGDGDMLLAICRNETSYLLLGEYQLQNSDNSGTNTLSTNIVGTIRNIGFRTGIQERSSFINYNGDVYWWDEFNGIVVQYTNRGAVIISDIKNKSRFQKKKGSGYARFSVDPFYEMLFIKVGTTDAVGFSIVNNQWVSNYTFGAFSQAINYGDKCLYFAANKIYRSLENGSSNKYGEYLGSSSDSASLSTIANTIVPIVPKFIRIDHNMDVFDYSKSNYIKDNLLRVEVSNENGQSCVLSSVNFNVENNKLYSHVLRDQNSVGGVVSGVHIQGYSNTFKLILLDKTQDMRIFGINIEADPVTGH